MEIIQEVLTKDLSWYNDKIREWKSLLGNICNETLVPSEELVIPILTVYGCNALGIGIVFTKDKYFFIFCQGSEKRSDLFKRFISGEKILVKQNNFFIISETIN